ncbi:MAG: GIY-YIG nuclease family protein [Melioribacteraceae bacterium]|nr:GIY-YIG nuclease family protein [Melioribacteraceae bacterium]
MELKLGLEKVQKTTNSDKGIYILELFAEKDFSISAKKFIGFTFPKGYYYYVGSAQKNLKSRIARHLRRKKKVHWHIDHLTTHNSVKTLNSFIIPEAEKIIEAEIANNFVNYFDAQIIVEGFGNSDTKETKTHLYYKKGKIKGFEFQRYYHFKN